MKWTTQEAVQQANAFALQALRCEEVPALKKELIGKMGLKGVPGLRVLPKVPKGEQPEKGASRRY